MDSKSTFWPDGRNWTEGQWVAYENAEVFIPILVLESLIMAAFAHTLGVQPSKDQRGRWRDEAKTAETLLEKVVAEVEAKAEVEVIRMEKFSNSEIYTEAVIRGFEVRRTDKSDGGKNE